MSKIRLTKRFEFHMAHAMEGYEGKCSHIHGHGYQLLVTVIGTPSSEDGMVMDFAVLKNLVQEKILDYYDHSLVLKKSEKSEAVFEKLDTQWGNVHLTDFQPSSENILLDMVSRLNPFFSKQDNVSLYSVKLCETETSFAEWFAEDNI